MFFKTKGVGYKDIGNKNVSNKNVSSIDVDNKENCDKKSSVLLVFLIRSIIIVSRNNHTSMCESWGEGELSSVVLL